ncbi:hypothetical protein E2C01_093988 [Portunus trituberculatus]|uniref:Uncharacterized protein n=1 Tax=Portunus trituberculatus TaxID=210409 RepID=A0A5B7K1Y0_PORTR|nr:hypothetical protein [Portunus trituberculatus]
MFLPCCFWLPVLEETYKYQQFCYVFIRRDLQSCLSVVKSAKLMWQSHWDNLHLHTTKPILGERASSNRRTRREVVLARLRMGCTLPTQMLPYIANTFPPQCSTCNVTLSVEHILLHCVRYREERRP